MEIVKYLCEFFFNDFWHWIGLVILAAVIVPRGIFEFNKIIKNKEKNQE